MLELNFMVIYYIIFKAKFYIIGTVVVVRDLWTVDGLNKTALHKKI